MPDPLRDVVAEYLYQNTPCILSMTSAGLIASRILALVEADARERERKAFVDGAVWDRVATSGDEATEATRRYKP